jgi:hypothetical protein
LRDQRSQSALQGAALQTVAQHPGDGLNAHAVRVWRDQIYQLIQLGLGGDAWHVLGSRFSEPQYRVTLSVAQVLLRHIKCRY